MRSIEIPFFSIVIPVYNAADRLKIMVNGLRKQSCQDFEVILVDDKSTDDTLVELNKIVRKYPNFHLLEMESNQGVGPSRNLGINSASGQYLILHDADDRLLPDALFNLKEHIIANQFPDLTVFNYSIYNEKNELVLRRRNSFLELPATMNGLFVFKAICSSDINSAVWNKAFKNTTWKKNELRFLDDVMTEDASLIPFACLKMQNATFCSAATYCYYQHDGGITNEISDRQVAATYEALMGLHSLLKALPNYYEIEQDFLRYSFTAFHRNFYYAERNRRFSNDQILKYGDLFFAFCKEFSLGPIHILGSSEALKLFEGFLIENRRRRLDRNFNITLSLEQVEEILDHILVTYRQFELGMENAGAIQVVQKKWLKEENDMKRKMTRLKLKNERLMRNPFYWFGQFVASWYKVIFRRA